jgi:hypothetical protein
MMGAPLLTPVAAEVLRAWTELWLIEAADLGFLKPPYSVDDDQIAYATALHALGLNPAEAVQAMFAVHH